MRISDPCVMTINGGSSSIKFAVYLIEGKLSRVLGGQLQGIGGADAILTSLGPTGADGHQQAITASDYLSAGRALIDWLEGHVTFASVRAVGHRIVHGMDRDRPETITESLLEQLQHLTPYDSSHLPLELELIGLFRNRYPKLRQVACFDTAFHRTMPRIAQLFPIPRRFEAMGVRRYGFHGLSYAYVLNELTRLAGARAAEGRVILAHLGSGASMAAVSGGHSVDTSMGFTPTGGISMGTRPGDLDPGVAWFMMQSENLTPEQFNDVITRQSGLLGVSETSSDMRGLLEREENDVRAAEAVELFCYQAKKCVGAFAAVLGGLDVFVFSGGIGENSPIVRARICDGLEFLGIEIDEDRNMANLDKISSGSSRVSVRVIRTDEESMIASMVCQALGIRVAG